MIVDVEVKEVVLLRHDWSARRGVLRSLWTSQAPSRSGPWRPSASKGRRWRPAELALGRNEQVKGKLKVRGNRPPTEQFERSGDWPLKQLIKFWSSIDAPGS